MTESRMTFVEAEWALFAIVGELRKIPRIDGAYLEYPNYVSITIDGRIFILGFAEFDEFENPIAERMWLQYLGDDGAFVDEWFFDYMPNAPINMAQSAFAIIDDKLSND